MRQRSSSNIHTQKYIPLEDKVFTYFIVIFSAFIFLILQINAHFQEKSFEEYGITPISTASPLEVFVWSVGLGITLALILRTVLRAMIFSNLDKITRTVFARRIFEATGSIAKDQSGHELDGRIHFFLSFKNKCNLFQQKILYLVKNKARNNSHESKNPIQKFQSITLTRTPEPPRMPLEEFSNDELGRLALALEEDSHKQALYEKIFQGLLDNIPIPIIATSRDSSFFLVNQRFREIFPNQNLAINPESKSPESVLRSSLDIPENLIASAIRVLDQKSPRIFAKEFTFRNQNRESNLPVSITTLSKLGKRIAIISIHENLSTEQQATQQALCSIANRKLDITQNILETIDELDPQKSTSLRAHCESLNDLLNTELDLLHADSEDVSEELVEFSLSQLLSSVSRVTEPNKLEITITENTPKKVFGSPSHIRHFLIAALHEFFTLNRCTARICIAYSDDESMLEISIKSPKIARQIQDTGVLMLFKCLSRSYQISFNDRVESTPHDFMSFSTAAKRPEEKQRASFSMNASLKEKTILTIVSSADTCIQQLQIIRALGAKEIVFHDFITFRRNEEDISAFDAAIILSGSTVWRKDQDVLTIINLLKEHSVPILLVPQAPRRGDSTEASKFGIAGYLRRPFSLTELREILFTLCNKEALGKSIPKGIITRFAASELTKESHTVIVSALCTQDEQSAADLLQKLTSIGFHGIVVIGIHELVRQLFENEKAMLFYPGHMTSGQRRQLAIASEGHLTFAYESNKHGHAEASVTSLSESTTFVEPPFTAERLLAAIQKSLKRYNKADAAPSRSKQRRSA
jgi:hypothetical protein